MSEATDIKLWKDRLAHARDVWEEQGLIGTDNLISDMRTLFEFYAGNQWFFDPTWGGTRLEGDRIIANKIFEAANTTQARVGARNPRVQVFPRNNGSLEDTRVNELIVNYDIEELNMLRQWNAALRDSLFAPFGLTRHGFTPSEEFVSQDEKLLQPYGSARPDKPWIRRVPIWDVLIDPLAENFRADGDARWVAFRSLMLGETIKSTPGMIWPRNGIQATTRHPGNAMRSDKLRDMENPDFENLIEVYTIYEKVERTWMQLVIDGHDKWLRKPDDWPIPWETLPYDVLYFNERYEDPFPIPPMAPLIPLQMEKNKLRTMMATLVKRLRRVILAHEGSFTEDEMTKVMSGDIAEWFKTTNLPENVIKEIQIGGFSQDLLMYDAKIDEEIRGVLGHSKMTRGERINVESASEAVFVNQGTQTQTDWQEREFRLFTQESIRKYMQGRRATTTMEELVPLLGMEDADTLEENQFLTVSPEQLAGEYEYRVEIGSTLPQDRDREAQRALADLQVAKIYPDLHNAQEIVRRYWEARGISPAKVMQQQQQRPQALGEEAARQAAGGNSQGGGVLPLAIQGLGQGQGPQ